MTTTELKKQSITITFNTLETMNIFRINTTAFEEEDFYLMTDLSEQDIIEVINPLVNQERDGYEKYDNESLVYALEKRFPNAHITFIPSSEYIETISI